MGDINNYMDIIITLGISYVAYYILVSIGISFGYHAYFSHKSFKTNSLVEILFLICGIICGGRSALTWCGVHRMHHEYSDTEQDPHSPSYNSWYTILFSLWKVKNIPRRFIKDLLVNPRIMFFHNYRTELFVAVICAVYILNILPYLALVIIFSYLGFGTFLLFSHSNKTPVNRRWVNIFAPFEGKHKDHHDWKPIK